MSIKDSIQTAVSQIFDIADSLTTEATYHQAGNAPFYNPDTQTTTRPSTAHAGVKVIFVGYEDREIDQQNVMPTDQKALIEAQAVTFKPKTDDWIVIGTETWNVVRVKLEPSESVYILQVRKAGSTT